MCFRAWIWCLVAAFACARPSVAPQPKPPEELVRLEALRTLPLERVGGTLPIRASRGFAARGTVVGAALGEQLAFYRERLDLRLELELYVLADADWRAVTELPYGLPFTDRGVVVVPAGGGVIAETFLAMESSVPQPTLERLAKRGLTWAHAVDELVDLIGYHEAGHAFVTAHGIEPPTRWLDELLASYFAYAFLHAKRPALAETWDMMATAMLDGPPPAHRSLADFERLYVGVGVANYAWYQQLFLRRLQTVHAAQELQFLAAVKRAFPRAGVASEDTVDRLERIAPGFRDWAREH